MAPNFEQDTAAADAVLEGASGMVKTLDRDPLVYGKDHILNPWFLVVGAPWLAVSS